MARGLPTRSNAFRRNPRSLLAGFAREESMAIIYRRAMDALSVLCVVVAGLAVVLISFVIPWAVYTRYVLNSAASWPEPTAVLLTIVLTFFGAAACYREGLHMRVTVVVELLPAPWQRAATIVRELLVALMGLFMLIY